VSRQPAPRPDDAAAREAERLRAAVRRRGPVEARLGANRGQAAIVRERDRVVEALIRSASAAGARLLDVGCGEGATLGRLISVGAVATGAGVDLLQERIDRARTEWPGVDFRVADARSLPFPDGSFDAVLAMTVFSSVPLPARAAVAAEIARVIRPGGVFAWYDLRLPNPANPDVRPFCAADVATLFRGWDVQVRRLTVLPPIARRLGPAAGALYPVLARFPLVLSHEAGVARRPDVP
jgi:SAM-dependent methyltransferase